MTRVPLYQVDAFAARCFEGNPAAVVPLPAWPEDDVMRAVAAENNLAETAFFVPGEEEGLYALRWFTPTVEVDLCGHATLASAHVIFGRIAPGLDAVRFETRSGMLVVRRAAGGRLAMDAPARAMKPMAEPRELGAFLDPVRGTRPRMVLSGANLMAVYETAEDVARLAPAFEPLRRYLTPRNQGVIATAPGPEGSGVDFVSRYFAPAHGINEDHVTGSAHCDLMPFWARRLGRDALVARQISQRGGTVWCRLDGTRVVIEGTCADYLEGLIVLPG